MKKICLCLLAAGAVISSWAADKAAGTISANPNPAVVSLPLTVTINLTSTTYSGNVYLYTWCTDESDNKLTENASWSGSMTDNYKMSGSGSTFTYTIENLKSFYNLDDGQVEKLSKLYFIAHTSDEQTVNLGPIEVVEAPVQKYSGGNGSVSEPYKLATANDLKALSTASTDWGACFVLEADIDATGISATIGDSTTPFTGTFDGNGKLVKNLSLTGTTVGEGTGLFGFVGEGADIHDLGVVDATINGATFSGILAGKINGGSVARCYTTGSVSATSICAGGLAGENGGTITDCYSTANVTNSSGYATGGLVGKNTGTISNTIASGEVTGLDYVGGVVGANYGSVSNSVSVNASITSYNNYAARFGGNNNSRNVVSGNHAWDVIPAGHGTWTEHGDHATLRTSNELVSEQKYKTLTAWDFDNVWVWHTAATRSTAVQQGPALRPMGDSQPYIFPDVFFQTVSGIEAVQAGKVDVCVAPNPTEGMLNVSAPVAIHGCRLFTLGGQKITDVELDGSCNFSIDLSGYASGLYLLEVDCEGETPSVFKIIKK